jgi:hypothetical protein
VRGLVKAEEKAAVGLYRVLAIPLVDDTESLPTEDLRGIGVEDVAEAVDAGT